MSVDRKMKGNVDTGLLIRVAQECCGLPLILLFISDDDLALHIQRT